ncbi:MAG TPA: glycosyl hydrolase family 18 protein [Ignavibacteriales bacterium]|nr:glycosyl hydrolase family 18 protein [Ignavibacteriales bacterium]
MNSNAVKVILVSLVFVILLFLPSLVSQGEKHSHLRVNGADTTLLLSKKPLIPQNKNMRATVFGYLPSWKYPEAAASIRYRLLTHLAIFDFAADKEGNLTNPEMWPWTDVIDSAHTYGVKVIMTVLNPDSLQIHNILTDSLARQRSFENIKNTLQEFSLDGVNIDFENLKRSDRNEVISGYMKDLTAYIHKEFPGSEVSFAGPAVNWGGWNFKRISESCDYIFVMGYDYTDSRSNIAGPTASLNGSYYSIESTLLSPVFGYGEVTSTNPQKLILGVPYYGNHWITETGHPQAFSLRYVETPTFSTLMQEAEKFRYKKLWDKDNNVPWFRFQKNGQWHQVWFEDERSIGMKYDYAMSKNLKGVGIWALGYDGSRSELWDAIEKRFLLSNFTGLAARPLSPQDVKPLDYKTLLPKDLQLPKSGKGV